MPRFLPKQYTAPNQPLVYFRKDFLEALIERAVGFFSAEHWAEERDTDRRCRVFEQVQQRDFTRVQGSKDAVETLCGEKEGLQDAARRLGLSRESIAVPNTKRRK